MATAMLQAYSMRNQPPMVFITNNGKGKDLKCLGYVYYKKQCNKKSWNYFCKSKNCNASISIRVGPEGKCPYVNCRKWFKKEASKFI